MGYTFSRAREADSEQIFGLINRRIEWLRQMGIPQWDKIGYWKAFPKEYYMDAIRSGRLYVLRDEDTDAVAAVGVISQGDRGWDDRSDAMYLHNFATEVGIRGLGEVYLNQWERLAASLGKKRLRLDCGFDNSYLDGYYLYHGFRAVGRVSEDGYEGVLREKLI